MKNDHRYSSLGDVIAVIKDLESFPANIASGRIREFLGGLIYNFYLEILIMAELKMDSPPLNSRGIFLPSGEKLCLSEPLKEKIYSLSKI